MINIPSINRELNRLKSIRAKALNVLEHAPEGSIYYRTRGRSQTPIPYRLLCSNGQRIRKRIPACDQELIKALQRKAYAKHILRKVEENIKALSEAQKYQPLDASFLNYKGEMYGECRRFFFGSPELDPAFAALPERQNPLYPEQLNVATPLGTFRSKGEYQIAKILSDFGVAYKYEAPLELDGIPDIRILRCFIRFPAESFTSNTPAFWGSRTIGRTSTRSWRII